MFDQFLREFPPDTPSSFAQEYQRPSPGDQVVFKVIEVLGGRSYGGGVYRVLLATEIGPWAQRVTLCFPGFEKRITCFGYDWLGRLFAEDSSRVVDGLPGIVMFEPGSGEALEIPANILTFHDEELIHYRDAALATEFFQEWLGHGGKSPALEECIGYKRPLFLGGKDRLENLELCDIDVYWHISSQLIRQVRGLPEGAKINIR